MCVTKCTINVLQQHEMRAYVCCSEFMSGPPTTAPFSLARCSGEVALLGRDPQVGVALLVCASLAVDLMDEGRRWGLRVRLVYVI